VPTWTPPFTSTVTPTPTSTPAFTPTPTPEPSAFITITDSSRFPGSLPYFGLPAEGVSYGVHEGWELWGTFDVFDHAGGGVKVMIDVRSDRVLTFTVGIGYWEFTDKYCSGIWGSSFRLGAEDFGGPGGYVYAERGLVLCWDEELYQATVYQHYLTRADSAFALAVSTTRARVVGWWYIRVEGVSTSPYPPTPAPSPSPTITPTPTPDPAAPAWRVRFEAPAGAECRLGSLPVPCSEDWMAVSPGVVSLSFSGSGAGAIWVENGSAVGKTVGLRASLSGVPAEVCTPGGCYPANSLSSSTTVPAGAQVRAIYVSQGGVTGEEPANAFVDLSGGGGGDEGEAPRPTPTPTPIGGLPPGCRYEFAPPSVTPIPSISCLWFPPPVDLSWLGIGRTPALRVCFQRYTLSIPLLDFILSQVGLGGVTLSFQSFVSALTIATAFYALIRIVRRG